MALLQVNPTRMELTRLKKRLIVARRGHKLLKDKRDELMKKFLDIIRRNKELREQVEECMTDMYGDFLLARSFTQNEYLEAALMVSRKKFEIEEKTKNIMSVEVPDFEYKEADFEMNDVFSYSFVDTSAAIDTAIQKMAELMPRLIELAQVEKSAQLLSEEIERTRRRVNALEHVMIPQLTDTIKYITMKLDESERGNLSRLMKFKDMMLKEAIEKRKNSN